MLLPTVQPILKDRLLPFSTIEETREEENRSRYHDGNKILRDLDCNQRLILEPRSKSAVCSWLLRRWLFSLAPGGGHELLPVWIIQDNCTLTRTSLTPRTHASPAGAEGATYHRPPGKEGRPRGEGSLALPKPQHEDTAATPRLSSPAASPKAGEQRQGAGRGNPKATETVRPEVFPSVFGFLIPL